MAKLKFYFKPKWKDFLEYNHGIKDFLPIPIEDWAKSLKKPPAYPAYNKALNQIELWLVGDKLGEIPLHKLWCAGNWMEAYEEFEKKSLYAYHKKKLSATMEKDLNVSVNLALVQTDVQNTN